MPRRVQYVNLPYDEDERQGSYINYEVEASELAGDDIGHTEWWIDAVPPDNPTQPPNVDQKYLSRAQRARVRNGQVRNRRERFRNRVYLPHVGGDVYKIMCNQRGERGNDDLEVDEVITYRKLFYTVHLMNDACETEFNAVKDQMEAAVDEGYVELENVTTDRTRVDEAHTRSTNALTHLYNRRPRLSDRPFHLRVVILNDIYERKTRNFNAAGISGASHTYTPTTSGGEVFHLQNNGIVWVRARINGTGPWRDVTRYATQNTDVSVTVRLTGDDSHARTRRAIADGGTVNLRFRLKVRDSYNGHSIGNFVCVRIRDDTGATRNRNGVLKTLVHEVGHGCQQAVRRERLYNANGIATGRETNALWHTDNRGGRGNHCSHNCTLVNVGSRQEYRANAGSVPCVMIFYGVNTVVDGKFCPTCLPRVRRANMNSANMRRRSWHRY